MYLLSIIQNCFLFPCFKLLVLSPSLHYLYTFPFTKTSDLSDVKKFTKSRIIIYFSPLLVAKPRLDISPFRSNITDVCRQQYFLNLAHKNSLLLSLLQQPGIVSIYLLLIYLRFATTPDPSDMKKFTGSRNNNFLSPSYLQNVDEAFDCSRVILLTMYTHYYLLSEASKNSNQQPGQATK